jgi:hypothetical protein
MAIPPWIRLCAAQSGSMPDQGKELAGFLFVPGAERLPFNRFPGGNGTSDCCCQQQVLHQTLVSVRKEKKRHKESVPENGARQVNSS